MEALRVEGLFKNFGGVKALEDISFSVQVGDRLVIIGPNGAGKTTLFNLLSGQLPPTRGKIYFFGKDITTVNTYRRAQLGLVRSFQICALFFDLPVLDNIMLAVVATHSCRFETFRPITGYPHLFRKAQKLLESMGLWDKKDEIVRNLSHGEQRKMEILLSLGLEPKLLLLDEPTCGLTGAETSEFIRLVREVGSNITVIIVAHDMDLVFGVADRIIVLHHGQTLAEGLPEEIKSDPRVKEIYMGIEGENGQCWS